MKNKLYKIAKDAGKILLQYYKYSVQVSWKKDGSPITVADYESHKFLVKSLQSLQAIPVLSEENSITYSTRKNWKTFWLIDPLDGTQEFINRHNDFCINIALIKNNKPILGLIYAPALNEIYYAEKLQGVFYDGPTHKRLKTESLVTGISRFHHSKLVDIFLKKNNLNKTLTIGSSLKFGRLATGQIDIYPRFEGSKEWDIAAGHLIVQEAEGNIIDLISQKPPTYNKNTLKNNYFIVARNGIDLNNFVIPKF